MTRLVLPDQWLRGATFLMLLLAGGASGLQAAPLNDYFSSATVIKGLTNFTVSNLGATVETSEPNHASESPASTLWWRWTAPYTGTFRIVTSNSVINPQTPLDTVVAVYTGTLLANLTYVTANDDTIFGEFGALWSRVVFRAYAGETFRIAVGSLGGQGTIRMDVGNGGPLAPTWQVPDLTGQPVYSSNYLGQLVMIDFWETTCTACIEELPDLRQVQDLYHPKGFTFLGLSGDPNVKLVTDYLQGHPMNYPIAMSTPVIQRALNGTDVGYPTKFLIDPDGRVVSTFVGGSNIKFYRSMIEPLVRSDSRTRLSVARVGADVRVSWPAQESAYSLQGGPGPRGPWSEVTSDRVIIGNEVTVTLGATNLTRFFRLAKR